MDHTAFSHSRACSHSSPQEVNLSFNELDQSAALAVADALANKEALRTIDLNGEAPPTQRVCLKDVFQTLPFLPFLF